MSAKAKPTENQHNLCIECKRINLLTVKRQIVLFFSGLRFCWHTLSAKYQNKFDSNQQTWRSCKTLSHFLLFLKTTAWSVWKLDWKIALLLQITAGAVSWAGLNFLPDFFGLIWNNWFTQFLSGPFPCYLTKTLQKLLVFKTSSSDTWKVVILRFCQIFFLSITKQNMPSKHLTFSS